MIIFAATTQKEVNPDYSFINTSLGKTQKEGKYHYNQSTFIN